MEFRLFAIQLTCQHKIDGRSIARIVPVTSGPYAAEVGPYLRVEFADGGRNHCYFPNDEVQVTE